MGGRAAKGSRGETTARPGACVLDGGGGACRSSRARGPVAVGWGADEALGINVFAARFWLMALSAVVTAAAVAASGAIGFIGLLVPHVVRILIGPMHRTLLPMASSETPASTPS